MGGRRPLAKRFCDFLGRPFSAVELREDVDGIVAGDF
jgi:hypothetical protein